MSNLTTVTLTSGVATAGTGTVSTIDNLIGTASIASSNVLSVQLRQKYQSISSSTSVVALSGGGGGAVGDYLDTLLIVPGTAAASSVSISDGSTGATISVFAGGGTTALPSLIPFPVPIGATSVTSAWHVTLGANVSLLAIGTFT